MGSIYRKAQKTVIRLGTDTEFLIQHIQEFGRKPSPHFPEPPLNVAFAFTKSPCWSRAWTLQEAVLAKEAVFYGGVGSTDLSMQHLALYVDALREHFLSFNACCGRHFQSVLFEPIIARALTVVDDLLRRKKAVARGESFDPLELAFSFNSREATDLRDRVFGYLGLCHDPPQGCIGYNLPLEDCYVNFSKLYIQHTASLEPLSYVHHVVNKYNVVGIDERYRLRNIPSWCPDWSQIIHPD
jgi:hypothetical protein